MRSVRAVLSIGLALATLLPAGPAPASTGGAGCGEVGVTFGSTTTRSCLVVLRGLPISVRGDLRTTTAADASVHVWLTWEFDHDTVLWECEDPGTLEGGRRAFCQNRIDPSPVIVDPKFPIEHLRCWARGKGTGTYSCVSGTGT